MHIKFEVEHIWMADCEEDFRKGVDGLCAIIIEQLKEQPGKGLYVFYNKRRNRLKLIGWHGNGFMMLYKRVS